ncbi:MAG: FAD-dependent oxidoreductase [Deltaproteobacteria bacterium]|nr:FAD-dependent oxidoreductase [Deltaproteobacteria bacterium]
MKTVLVIGGGVTGLKAASELAGMGYNVSLVEKEDYLGGQVVKHKYYKLAPDLRPAGDVIDPVIKAVESNSNIKVHKHSRVVAVSGNAPEFKAKIKNSKGESEETFGAIVVATGFEHFDPIVKQEYGYGRFKDVVTNSEVEEMLNPNGPTKGELKRPSDGKVPKKIAIFQCVGSRDKQVGNPYCCRVGCVVSTKQAIEIKEKCPDSEVYVYYMDMRMFGRGWEELYGKAMEDYEVIFTRGRGAEVTLKNQQLSLRAEETVMNRPIQHSVDMIILAAGIAAGDGTIDAAKVLGIKQNDYGFLAPKDDFLSPNESSKAGIYIAGADKGPLDIENCIVEGAAVAAKVASNLKN